MIGLFDPARGFGLPAFLREAGEWPVLLADPAFLAALPEHVHDGADQGGVGPRVAGMPVVALQPGAEAAIAALPPGQLCLVADPHDEAAALSRLRAAHPGLRLLGLGADLAPALVARRPGAIHGPAPEPCRDLALIFAPPRSGSSLVADLVGHVTGAAAREHLRRPVLDLLAAPYAFDRTAAVRRFLDLIAVEGRAASKLISHFMQNALGTGAERAAALAELRTATAGIAVTAIVIARADTVAQAVSGYLAMQRGVWHLETAADAARLAAAPAVAYEFDGILKLYRFYGQQDRLLDVAREGFPGHLALSYERDIAAGDTGALGARIAAFLGRPWTPPAVPPGRQRLANAENAAFCARFAEEYRARFGAAP